MSPTSLGEVLATAVKVGEDGAGANATAATIDGRELRIAVVRADVP
jgi:hypothetical protein